MFLVFVLVAGAAERTNLPFFVFASHDGYVAIWAGLVHHGPALQEKGSSAVDSFLFFFPLVFYAFEYFLFLF